MVIRNWREHGPPQSKRWTRREYERLADAGCLADQRLELIAGEILEMTPQRGAHAMAIGLVECALRRAFGESHWIRVQMPLALSADSEPEPDLAVVTGSPRDYPEHPAHAALVVEISDTTLAFDRARKAGLYAAAGIEEYWIVNLVDERLEVCRCLVDDADAEFGRRYEEVVCYARGSSVAPLAAPGRSLAVDDLLP